jgi:hypothetical protein
MVSFTRDQHVASVLGARDGEAVRVSEGDQPSFLLDAAMSQPEHQPRSRGDQTSDRDAKETARVFRMHKTCFLTFFVDVELDEFGFMFRPDPVGAAVR